MQLLSCFSLSENVPTSSEGSPVARFATVSGCATGASYAVFNGLRGGGNLLQIRGSTFTNGE